MRALCMKQFEDADNMTIRSRRFAARQLRLSEGCRAWIPSSNKWKNEPLVVDKWLAVQSTTGCLGLADVKR